VNFFSRQPKTFVKMQDINFHVMKCLKCLTFRFVSSGGVAIVLHAATSRRYVVNNFSILDTSVLWHKFVNVCISETIPGRLLKFT